MNYIILIIFMKLDDESSVTFKNQLCPSYPCLFKRGTNMTIEFTFKSGSDHDELYHLIFLNITGIRQNMLGTHNTPACPLIHPVNKPDSNGCPLKAGVQYLYHLGTPIDANILKVDYFVFHFSLHDRAKEIDSVCFEASGKIVD